MSVTTQVGYPGAPAGNSIPPYAPSSYSSLLPHLPSSYLPPSYPPIQYYSPSQPVSKHETLRRLIRKVPLWGWLGVAGASTALLTIGIAMHGNSQKLALLLHSDKKLLELPESPAMAKPISDKLLHALKQPFETLANGELVAILKEDAGEAFEYLENHFGLPSKDMEEQKLRPKITLKLGSSGDSTAGAYNIREHTINLFLDPGDGLLTQILKARHEIMHAYRAILRTRLSTADLKSLSLRPEEAGIIGLGRPSSTLAQKVRKIRALPMSEHQKKQSIQAVIEHLGLFDGSLARSNKEFLSYLFHPEEVACNLFAFDGGNRILDALKALPEHERAGLQSKIALQHGFAQTAHVSKWGERFLTERARFERHPQDSANRAALLKTIGEIQNAVPHMASSRDIQQKILDETSRVSAQIQQRTILSSA